MASPSSLGPRSLADRLTDPERVPEVLAGIVAVALAVRVSFLGLRVAHWDEARIAFWILEFQRTGQWSYFPVHHGPLLFHVNRWVFATLGASDATMRLPVALVGGVLPAAAWLYRDHLDAAEVVGLGILLAGNPILVYYSRFMRNDLLVAAFAFVALGLFLRARASGWGGYLVGGGILLGLAFGSKENALLYLASWAGAGGLLLVSSNGRLGVGVEMEEGVQQAVQRVSDGIRRWGPWALAAGLAFLLTSFLLYVPRGRSGPTLQNLVGGTVPPGSVVSAALLVPAREAISFWLLGSAQGDYPYPVFLGLLVGLLLVGALATTGLAAWGLYHDRERPIVAFAGLWAVLGIVGYPAATDLMAAWIVVHVIVPLTIPASVGLGVFLRRLAWEGEIRESRDSKDREETGLAGRSGPGITDRPSLALSAVGTYLLVTVLLTSFIAPGATFNPLGQPSQMEDEARTSIDAMLAHSDGAGTDMAYVGPYWRNWIHRLPFIWYLERAGATRTVVDTLDALDSPPPPVLIANASDRGVIQDRYPGYRCRAHQRVPWAGGRPKGLPGAVLICVEP
ncbi:MAG: flippase activity-associated protein Agl23 [Halodesulfurarchaeum sp.]